MKRIIWAVLILVAVGAGVMNAGEPPMSTSILTRVTDGIGRQYGCVSANMKNQYGFGGEGDTLAADTTVQRGCRNNIRRCLQSGDAVVAELLPQFMSSRTQLDSAYQYGKWSAICWAINNAFADSGGLSGVIQSRAALQGKLSPRFARVARANGIYLVSKAVFSDTLNFGSSVLGTDSAYTYSDSNAIDSTLFSPIAPPDGFNGVGPAFKIAATGTGTCTLLVWGSNQSLTHGRRWYTYVTQASTGPYQMTPTVAGDSCYNIDSSKVKAYTGTLAGTILFFNRVSRVDSL